MSPIAPEQLRSWPALQAVASESTACKDMPVHRSRSWCLNAGKAGCRERLDGLALMFLLMTFANIRIPRGRDIQGHWDGDTHVVESVGFNDKTWLDIGGHPDTGNLRVTERFDGRRSPEHAHVKIKRHGVTKYDHGIVGVPGIQ